MEKDDDPRRKIHDLFYLPKLTEPDWCEWESIRYAELWDVVALSCNIDPNCLRNGDVNRRPLKSAALRNFARRLKKAVADLDKYGGELHGENVVNADEKTLISIGNFRTWALSKDEQLPESFPSYLPTRPQRETSMQRCERLRGLVEAELRVVNTKKQALENVASREISTYAGYEGKSISYETLRRIIKKCSPAAG